MSTLLLALVVPAFLFTLRLKYGEWVVLKVFCPWRFISTVSITACLILAWLDWRGPRPSPHPTTNRQGCRSPPDTPPGPGSYRERSRFHSVA